jgi:hypothetical protein
MNMGRSLSRGVFSKLKGEGPSWLNLKAAIAAVVLFAPPFRGSDEFIEWTMNNSKLQDSMKRNGSQYLQQYWKDFRFVAQNPNIFVFAYLSKSAILMEKSNKAETLLIEGLEQDVDRGNVSLTENIWDIARFSGPSDRCFHSVTELISKKVKLVSFLELLNAVMTMLSHSSSIVHSKLTCATKRKRPPYTSQRSRRTYNL